MPDVQIVTYEFDRLVMTFENTGFTPYMFKTPPYIRDGDLFPFWPQNSDRIEIYGTKQMMYLARHGGGWQVFGAGPQELGQGFGKVVAQEFGRVADVPHVADFLECIRARKRPHGDIEVCHYSSALEHLANMAYRLGNQKLRLTERARHLWRTTRRISGSSRRIARLISCPTPFSGRSGLWHGSVRDRCAIVSESRGSR